MFFGFYVFFFSFSFWALFILVFQTDFVFLLCIFLFFKKKKKPKDDSEWIYARSGDLWAVVIYKKCGKWERDTLVLSFLFFFKIVSLIIYFSQMIFIATRTPHTHIPTLTHPHPQIGLLGSRFGSAGHIDLHPVGSTRLSFIIGQSRAEGASAGFFFFHFHFHFFFCMRFIFWVFCKKQLLWMPFSFFVHVILYLILLLFRPPLIPSGGKATPSTMHWTWYGIRDQRKWWMSWPVMFLLTIKRHGAISLTCSWVLWGLSARRRMMRSFCTALCTRSLLV